MAFTCSRDGEVFTWTLTGTIDADEFRRWFTAVRTTTLATPLQAIYHIVDVRTAQTDFSAILTQMRLIGESPPDVAYKGKHKVQIVIVGADAMARMISGLARLPQFGGFEMPIFRTMADALEYIRLDQAKTVDVTEDYEI